jgi:hypothetical protein
MIEDWFHEFWQAYPFRPGNPKKPAFEIYKKAIARGVFPSTILNAAKEYAATRSGEDPKYTAMARTWLGQERWTCEYELKGVNETVLAHGFYAVADSPQMAAWDAVYRARKGINGPRDRKGGWLFPTEWPPDGNIVSIKRTA